MTTVLEDRIWQMVAILNGQVEGSEMVAVLSAFVDESGTEDEPNVVLGVLVSTVRGWLDFNAEWGLMLAESNLDYAHFTEMRNNRGQFKEGWDTSRKDRFSRRSVAIIKKDCLFGFTVSLSKQLHREYQEKCRAERIGPDSAYAICAREVFGFTIRQLEARLGYTGEINFIFESGHKNAPNAAAVFDDLKAHSEIKDRLGFFALEDKKKLRPLQGSDHIAHQGRRNEAEALREGGIITVRDAKANASLHSVQGDGCPILYLAISEEILDFHRGQRLASAGNLPTHYSKT